MAILTSYQITPKVYIIILNWNGWQDTIECLESVFRNDYPNYQVIVCDNDSSDGSLNKIKEWAEGKIQAKKSDNEVISKYIYPPVCKPIAYVEYNREQTVTCDDDVPLVLIQTGANLGFAGGNNVGIRYALKKNDFSYIWLLNNDTVIDSSALRYLVNHMNDDSSYGICGSTLLFYHDPTQVQSLGGATYNKWVGLSNNIVKTNSVSNIVFEIENKMAFVVGASMLVSKEFLQEIGLMEESYFLYYEEIDWATRAKGKYKLGYSPQSVVYHKQGSTTGASSANPHDVSEVADYYAIRGRLLFTQNFHGFMLPTVYLGLLVTIFNRIRRRQFKRIIMIVKLMVKTQCRQLNNKKC